MMAQLRVPQRSDLEDICHLRRPGGGRGQRRHHPPAVPPGRATFPCAPIGRTLLNANRCLRPPRGAADIRRPPDATVWEDPAPQAKAAVLAAIHQVQGRARSSRHAQRNSDHRQARRTGPRHDVCRQAPGRLLTGETHRPRRHPGPHGHRRAPRFRGSGHPGGRIAAERGQGVPGRPPAWAWPPTPRTPRARSVHGGTRHPSLLQTGQLEAVLARFRGEITPGAPRCTPPSSGRGRSSTSWPGGARRWSGSPGPMYH